MDKNDEITREYLMDILNTNLNKMNNKFVKGRIKNDKNEKIKIEQFRSLVYAINTLNSILKDKQIDTMSKDLANLKESLSKTDYTPTPEENNKINDIINEIEEVTA